MAPMFLFKWHGKGYSLMATATIAKSVMRENKNISVGYGEVPACEIEGVLAWGLPGGKYTYSEEVALGWAIKIDAEISLRLISVDELITVKH